jgi:Xaa-Pro aminopeptidase
MSAEPELFFSKNEYSRRHAAIRALMQARGLDCLVIAGHDGVSGAGAADLRYIAGPLMIPEDGPFIIFPLVADPILITNLALGSEQGVIAAEQVSFKKGTRVRDYGAHVSMRLRDLGFDKGVIGLVTTRVMPVKEYLAMRKELPQADFVPADDIILQCRLVRSEEEVAFLRRSGELADAGMRAIVDLARPGVTENQLIVACDYAMAKAGGERGNFILIGSGPWDKQIVQGTNRKLEKGDVLVDEITSNYKGYYTQLLCPIVIGKRAPAGLVERMRVNNAMYQTACENLRPGAFVMEVEKRVEERAAGMGQWSRSWALQSAELAEAFHKVNLTIQKNMCFVVHPWSEPASGKGYRGHTIGNTCLVTDGDPEGLNKFPQEIITV